MGRLPTVWALKLGCALLGGTICACAETTGSVPDAEPGVTEDGGSAPSGAGSTSESESSGEDEVTAQSEETGSEGESEADETGGREDPNCDPTDPQACPDNLKCAPIKSSGSDQYDHTRCVEFGELEIGGRCDLLGNDRYSGDNCSKHAFCIPDLNLDSALGACLALCIFDEEGEASCAEPGYGCIDAIPGVAHICLETCVPGETDCGEGAECLPYGHGGDAFVCQDSP